MTLVVTLMPDELAALVRDRHVTIDGRIELRVHPGRGAAIRARVEAFLTENPAASANDVWRAIGGRRSEVLRAVKTVRTAQVVAESQSALGERPARYPERRNRPCEVSMDSEPLSALDARARELPFSMHVVGGHDTCS